MSEKNFEDSKWLLEANKKQSEEIENLNDEIYRLKNKNLKKDKELSELRAEYNSVVSSSSWKFTAPFRKLSAFLRRTVLKFAFIRLPLKAIKLLFKSGFKSTFLMVKHKLKSMRPFDYSQITNERRQREENTKFDKEIKFSVLVPLYNTPEKFLREMIESVVNQTYKNWELCLADGSDSEHNDVEKIVSEYSSKDNRIKYKKLEKNLGISENTNECIKIASGDYLALFDHDDYLHPSVLFENMKAICEHGADFIYTDEATFLGEDITKIHTFHFKPDFAPDNLRANNYICHFSVFSKELQEKTGYFRHEFDGSQDHDMILRLTSNASKIWHIRKLLYFWRSHPNSVASDINSKTYAIDAGIRAVTASLEASGLTGCTVESSKIFPTIYRISYPIKDNPLVSIIIANSDHKSDLKKCIDSILSKATYDNYEIIIVENNSKSKDIFDYYKTLKEHKNIRVINFEGEFNYSAVNNLGAENAKGDYLLLLNNDTEVITENFIEEMLMFAQREDVGAVGAKLYYEDNTIQHAGIILGLGTDRIAGHSHYTFPRDHIGYMGKLFYAHNLSAVTGACMMVKKEVFFKVGGLNTELKIAFNDIDFCLKLRDLGYLIVWNPYAELYHYESKSRGFEDSKEKKERFKAECEKFRKLWGKTIEKGDPYYNPNFSLDANYQIDFDELTKSCKE